MKQLNNKYNIINRPKIALDIDGVICEFKKAYCDKLGIKRSNNHWHFTYKLENDKSIYGDKNFWLNLPPLIKSEELLFEPVFYMTSRRIPIEWTKEWIELNGFPCEPIYSKKESKIEMLKMLYKNNEFDYFVDDAYKNFIELVKANIPTYLFDRPYNEKYNVGYNRLYCLNDLLYI